LNPIIEYSAALDETSRQFYINQFEFAFYTDLIVALFAFSGVMLFGWLAVGSVISLIENARPSMVKRVTTSQQQRDTLVMIAAILTVVFGALALLSTAGVVNRYSKCVNDHAQIKWLSDQKISQ